MKQINHSLTDSYCIYARNKHRKLNRVTTACQLFHDNYINFKVITLNLTQKLKKNKMKQKEKQKFPKWRDFKSTFQDVIICNNFFKETVKTFVWEY